MSTPYIHRDDLAARRLIGRNVMALTADEYAEVLLLRQYTSYRRPEHGNPYGEPWPYSTWLDSIVDAMNQHLKLYVDSPERLTEDGAKFIVTILGSCSTKYDRELFNKLVDTPWYALDVSPLGEEWPNISFARWVNNRMGSRAPVTNSRLRLLCADT